MCIAIEKKIEILKDISYAKQNLNILPRYHWHYHIKLDDLNKLGDIGTYDLIPRKTDADYSISDSYEFTGNNGYRIIDFSTDVSSAILFHELQLPEYLVHTSTEKKSIVRQQRIADLFSGHQTDQEIRISLREDAIGFLQQYYIFPWMLN